VASGIGAVALWAPPERWRESRFETLRMMPGLLWGLRGRISAFKAILDVAEHIHPEEPHWHRRWSEVIRNSVEKVLRTP